MKKGFWVGLLCLVVAGCGEKTAPQPPAKSPTAEEATRGMMKAKCKRLQTLEEMKRNAPCEEPSKQ